MRRITITIDGNPVEVEEGRTILQAARSANIYIPALCHHPALPVIEEMSGAEFVFRGKERIEGDPPTNGNGDGASGQEQIWEGCGICSVDVDGILVRACATEAANGMTILTSAEHVRAYRRKKLHPILATHPHACLTCAQAEGCPRTQCSSNVPEAERCCELLGSCELQKIAQYVGIPQDLPRYIPRGHPILTDEPLFTFSTELCVGCLRCVRACLDLRGIGTLSFVLKDGKPVVGYSTGPTRVESNCRFCGACVEVCPTGALMDTIRAVGDERLGALVPCRNGCPAGIDIPRYVRYVAKGEPEKAIGVVREKIPFVYSVSHVCFHPCEDLCRRGELNAPISVCRLKRYAALNDTTDWLSVIRKKPATGKNVAVVGSGPAGLTAAYFLVKQGHDVTVYEALGEPGGMLRVGIPEYRLPPEYLQRDIREIEAVGVRIECDSPVDETLFEKLRNECDALFLAAGANEAKRLDLPGAELRGVYWGVEFLRDRALGHIPADIFAGKDIIVVGGGNVAIDASRVALRLDASRVRIVCLESPDELPAWEWEVVEALEEGISFTHGFGPKEIKDTDGTVTSLTCKRCLRVFDDQGRFHPLYDEEETLDIETDVVILAIGQDPSTEAFSSVELERGGLIRVNEKTLTTSMSSVYAGGDIVRGPSSVIEAIAMGRRAAIEIDKALGGDGDIDEILVEREPAEHHLGLIENFGMKERRHPVTKNGSERKGSFTEIEAVFNGEDARMEAIRCLSCDLRLLIEPPPLPPMAESVFEMTPESIASLSEDEGVYQLLDGEKNVIAIKGVMNLRSALTEVLDGSTNARFFTFEKEPMYTKRESELIQQYLQRHGKLPSGGDDDLDDLF